MMSHNKPLMLKDYLELDSNSDSIIDQYASMRHLLQFELRGGSGRRQLIRTRSKNALLKLSSLMKLDFLLLSCSPSSINKSKNKSRCRSRNLLKKNELVEDHVRVKDDIVSLTSFNFNIIATSGGGATSPLPTSSSSSSSSSSTSWSQSDFTGSDFLPSSNGSSEFIPDITGANDKCSPVRTEASHGGSEKKVVTSELTGCNTEEEEKEQLSPISVMDFLYGEEEEEEEEEDDKEDKESMSDCSFQANLASIERARQALLQKIRRFESLAELVPVNLDNQLFSDVDEESIGNPATSDDDDVNEEEETTVEMQAWKLLDHIKSGSPIRIEGCIEKLLLEFLVQGLNCNSTRNDSFATKLVDAAKKWIESRSDCWEQRDHRGEMEIGQMDWNGRFSCFEEEQQEQLAVCLTSGVLGCLMDELVRELVFC